MNPFDYSMCCQTVTAYRRGLEGVRRLVIPGCLWQEGELQQDDGLGTDRRGELSLTVAGYADIEVGDRVMLGEGPQVEAESWIDFLIAYKSQLRVLKRVRPRRWIGRICHMEAGG